jgi:DNA-binding CsgD family transcriptional regulator
MPLHDADSDTVSAHATSVGAFGVEGSERYRLCAGSRYLSPRISSVVVAAMSTPEAALPAAGGLTGRQTEVLRCIARGLSNKQIARELAISPKTVEFHRAPLMQRLDLHDVASLTRYAVQAGRVWPTPAMPGVRAPPRPAAPGPCRSAPR